MLTQETSNSQLPTTARVKATSFSNSPCPNPTGAGLGTTTVARVDILDGSGSKLPPNSVAVGNPSVAPGELVTLDGSGSNDPDGDELAYQWTQTMGPGISLSNPDTASPTFVAPNVSSDTLLRFELQVTDPFGLSSISQANVTIVSGNSGGGGNGFGSGGGGGGTTSLLLLLLLAGLRGTRRLTRTDVAG